MGAWQSLSGEIKAQNLAWTIGILSILVASGAKAAEPVNVSNLPATAKTVKEWTAQVEAATAQVTAIRRTLGIYVQDQVALTENLKLLLGGRFDLFDQEFRFLNDITEISGNAFSPRIGLVYQPIKPISLYASYSRSFLPNLGTTFDGDPFQPERGTQPEAGIKAELSNRLSANLALYSLTRSNVLTTDPENPDFSIQTGEQRSRGAELSSAGEILPGWKIIAGYAYTDAQITEDNELPVGNRLNNVAENSFNLWTSYEIQQGTLRGLGFGLGLF